MSSVIMDMTSNSWCSECEALRELLSELKSAYAHQMNIICGLKEKIIPTDQLIIDVYTKQEENQALARSLEISKRLCEDLSQQLCSTLAQLEPLREATDKLNRHIQRYEKDIERLKADTDAYKISQKQLKIAHDSLYEKLKKSEEEKKEALNNFRKTELRLKRCQDELTVRKNDAFELNKENAVLQDEIKELKLEFELANYHENSISAFHTSKNLKYGSPCTNAPELNVVEGENIEPSWSSSHLIQSVTCHSVASHAGGTTYFNIAQLFESDLIKPLPPMISPLASPVSADLKLSDEADCSSDDDNISIDQYANLLESELCLTKDINHFQLNTSKDKLLSKRKVEDDEDGCEDTIPEVSLNEVDRKLDSGRLVSQLSTGFNVSYDIDLLSTKDSVSSCVASSSPSVTCLQHLHTLETWSALSLKPKECSSSLSLLPQLPHSTDAKIDSQQLYCMKYTDVKSVETQKMSVAISCIHSCVSTNFISTLSASSSIEDCVYGFPGSSSVVTQPSSGFECTYQNAQLSVSDFLSLTTRQSHPVENIARSNNYIPLSNSCDSLSSPVSLSIVSCNTVSSLIREKNLTCSAYGVVLSSVVNVVSVINEPICSPCITVQTFSNTLNPPDPSPLPPASYNFVASPSSCIACPAASLSGNCCTSSPADDCSFEIDPYSLNASYNNMSSFVDEVLSSASNLNELQSSSALLGIKSGIIDSATSNALPIISCIESQCNTASSLYNDVVTSAIDLLPSNVNVTSFNNVPLPSDFTIATLSGGSSISSTEPFDKISRSLCISTVTPCSIMPQSHNTKSATFINMLPASYFGTTVFSRTQSTACISSMDADSLRIVLPLSSSLTSVSKSCGDGDLGLLNVAKPQVDLDSIFASASKAKTSYANGDPGSVRQLSISLEGIFQELKIPSPLPPLSPVSTKCDAAQTDLSKSLSSKLLASDMPLLPVLPDLKLITEGRRTRRKSYPPEPVSITVNRNADDDPGSVSMPCCNLIADMNCLSTVSAFQVKPNSAKCKMGGERKSSVSAYPKIDASFVPSALSNSSNVANARGIKRKISESDVCSAETKVFRSLRSNRIIESPCRNDIPATTKGNCRNVSLRGTSVIQKSMKKNTQRGILAEVPKVASASCDSDPLSLKSSLDVAFLIKKTLQLNEDLVSMWSNRCRAGLISETKSLMTPSQEGVVAECQMLSDSLMKEFCDQAIQILSRKDEDAVMNGNMALCCVFVSLCRLMDDSEHVRMFVYDAIKQQYCGYCSLILCVAAVWPLPLQQNNSSVLDVAFPLVDVLQYIICAKALSASSLKKQKILSCFEMFCGWKLVTENADQIALRILNQLEEHLQQTSALSEAFTASVKMSFILLSVVEGWQWSNNFVVIQLLWPILSSWAADAETKSQTFVEAVIGILGSVMCNCPATCKNNTDQVIDVLLALLQEPSVAISIQLSVLQSLLMLTKFQPDRCATMCIQWVNSHRKYLDPKTKQFLQDYPKYFSPELKYISPAID